MANARPVAFLWSTFVLLANAKVKSEGKGKARANNALMLSHTQEETTRRGSLKRTPHISLASHQVERYFEILKFLASLLQQEPTVIHIPARPNRAQQAQEIRDMLHRVGDKETAILTFNLGRGETILWPHENLELLVLPDGTVVQQHSELLNVHLRPREESQRVHALLSKFCCNIQSYPS